MDNTEKARELINKHLYLHGGDELGITNGDVYRAVLDAVSEALTIPDVSQQRELLDEFCSTMEFDVKHETYEEDIDYFLENVKADNCA